MNWQYYDITRERHQELLRAAEQHRRARAARSSTAHYPNTFYAPALARLGRWLIAWGWRLRARYGEVEFYGSQHELAEIERSMS
jgi:hypothetical protein